MGKCPSCGGALVGAVKADSEVPRTMSCRMCSWPLSFSDFLDRMKQETVVAVILVLGFSGEENGITEAEGLKFLEKHNQFSFPLYEDKDAVAFQVENDQLIFQLKPRT